ncbi:MAG: ABC transporter permease [Lachnospiraceae bacterium]|nr:ABC transporter permease [Lachnospiraceae bacterium]
MKWTKGGNTQGPGRLPEDRHTALPEDGSGRTLVQEILRRFKKNRMAVAALGVLVVLLGISLGTLAIDLVTGKQVYQEYVVGQNLMMKLKGPSLAGPADWFGRDEFGRSVLFRVLWGTRYSLFIGLSTVGMATVAGGILGAAAGFYGGRLDNGIMRIMDVLLAIPYVLFAIAIVAALGPSIVNLLIAMTIPRIPSMARVVRAAVMTVKDREFVEAARAAGASDGRIIGKYILPNAASSIIVQATLNVAQCILGIAGLSYLGLGVQPPLPEWGAMLSSAKSFIRDAWHITVIPGLAITVTVLALNIFGDGLRDALDPKQRN